MIFQLFFCLFNRHDPISGEARWNGRMYAYKCRGCRKDIVRSKQRRGWTSKLI